MLLRFEVRHAGAPILRRLRAETPRVLDPASYIFRIHKRIPLGALHVRPSVRLTHPPVALLRTLRRHRLDVLSQDAKAVEGKGYSLKNLHRFRCFARLDRSIFLASGTICRPVVFQNAKPEAQQPPLPPPKNAKDKKMFKTKKIQKFKNTKRNNVLNEKCCVKRKIFKRNNVQNEKCRRRNFGRRKNPNRKNPENEKSQQRKMSKKNKQKTQRLVAPPWQPEKLPEDYATPPRTVPDGAGSQHGPLVRTKSQNPTALT